MDCSGITFRVGNDIDLERFVEILRCSTLGERRPLHNRQVMKAMLDHGDIIVSAWDGEQIVGAATTLTDFHRVAYLADLAVHVDYQQQGIGKELIRRTREALRPTCSIVLLSAPKANDYYPKVGFEHNPRAWTLDAIEKA
ncbi:MAG: GNAT family N-acetyltransferase [Phycisphaeraceae bacterium]|nr:GNAT family N-acetyltransferase [Phycisphaeraceae bacterium]